MDRWVRFILTVAALSCGGRVAGSKPSLGGSTSEDGAATVPEAGGEEEGEAESGLSPRPSCQPGGPGMSNCGRSSEICCVSEAVTGGTYSRIYDVDPTGLTTLDDAADGGPVGEAAPATVSSFNLDKYDVTVGRFRQFVNAWKAGWLPVAGSGKHTHLNGGQGLLNVGDDAGIAYEPGWVTMDDSNIAPTDANLVCDPNFATWMVSAGSNENRPINCVNWYEAYAFCIWDGGFLPSENEWQYAAAGGSQQRAYPWGSTPPGVMNQYAIYGYESSDETDCYYPTAGVCAGVTNIAPVGATALGAGVWGQCDLAGNVFALMLDSYTNSYVDPCIDCAYLTAASKRVFRGGSFDSPVGYLPPHRSALVDEDPAGLPLNRDYHVGFRCAQHPQ